MSTTKYFIRTLGLVAALLVPFACSTSNDAGNCADLCNEGQDKNCTVINGDCGNFCDAAFNIDEASGCSDQREDWQTCLNDADDVCGACESEENSYRNCIVPYCVANSSNADCQVMAGSF